MNRTGAISLARLSCVMPLVALAINLLFGGGIGVESGAPRPSSEMEAEILATGLFLLLGIIFSMVAMSAVRRFGPRQIRVPSVIGLIANSLVLILLIGRYFLLEG